jgi:hypothetical protein
MTASHQFRVVKTNLTHIHGWCLLQIEPWCINHINVIHLITLNGIRFNKLGTIFQYAFTYVIHCLTFIQSQIYMSRGHLIYMEPDVLGEPVLDEVLVLMLVEPHEDGVVAGVGPRFEVENHPESLAGGPPERIAEGRGSPGFGRRN